MRSRAPAFEILFDMPNGKSNKKTGKPSRRANKGHAKPSTIPKSDAGSIWSMPRRSIAFPDSLRTNLRYVIPLTQVTGGGTTNSLKFTSNAYDVDSALGSTAMAYFAELAPVYSRFRTMGVSYRFVCTNQEAFPNAMIHGFMTNSLSSTGLGQNYASGPYVQTDLLSAVNGSHSTRIYTGSLTVAKLFGTTQALVDDLFTGSTTSSTLSSSATMYIYIGAVSAAVPVNGFFVTGEICLDVLFDRRNSLFS
jgi:hypothetical protein